MRLLVFISVLLVLLSSSKNSSKEAIILPSTINLRWVKSHGEDKIDHAITSLSWCYSHLGATILNTQNLQDKNGFISVDITSLGFDSNAVNSLIFLHDTIQKTEEYQKNKAIDLGRYISLLIGSAEHYYKITGLPENLSQLLEQYNLTEVKGYVNNSLVSKSHRLLQFSPSKYLNQLFLSNEIDSISGKTLEYETMDIMENGQIRFGIYDTSGKIKISADPFITNAGKPAKCIWCHETNIQPLFSIQKEHSNRLSYQNLKDSLKLFKNKLNQDQLKLEKGVDFNKKQDHTWMELCYISFMEPSANRLSQEWGISVLEVKEKLKNLKTHEHDEFDFLGDLYHRNEVDLFAPYSTIKVSGRIREMSNQEVNYFE